MRNRLYKMLMNAEGSSPGGGAAPPPSGTPPAPSAGSAPTAVPMDQVKSLISDAVNQAQNGVFAKLRKAGVLKGGNDDEGAGGSPPAPPAASAGLSADDVQKLVFRATAFERVAVENKLTDAQRKRMDAALKAENPDDVSSWSTSYLTDMGIVKAPPSPTPNGGAPAPGAGAPRGPSSSDRGGPARDTSLAHEGQVWKMTPADVQALIREKGFQAAAHELRARMKQDLRGVRLLMPRPGNQ